jgi:electron transfer flavoprotein alpha subunit
MAGILIFSESYDTALELVAKGKEFKSSFGGRLAVLSMVDATEDKAKQFFSYGADAVYLAPGISTATDSGIYAQTIAKAVNTYSFDLVLIGSTRTGKEIAAIVAQTLGAGCITDATELKIKDSVLTAERYAFGGSTIATITINTPQKVIAVMPRAFPLPAPTGGQGEIISFIPDSVSPKVTMVQRQGKQTDSTPIEEAEILVCIGRGLSKQQDIPMIENMAKALKAEIGCTRPLTHDWQWFPESREVGLSGKKCKPALCVSVGISGQIQHTVGIRNSKIIVAINKDKNAPIFKTADYGIVADLYDVIPRLTKKFQALSSK